MAEAGIIFRRADGERIARAVKRVEGATTTTSLVGPRQPRRELLDRWVYFRFGAPVTGEKGRYNGGYWPIAVDAEATGAFAEEDDLRLGTAKEAIIWHLTELSGTDHTLPGETTNGIFLGRLAGTNPDGKGIVLYSNIALGRSNSPSEVGGSTEGSTTADTGQWERGTTPLKEWYVSRVVYDHAGDKKLYAFVRYRLYDTYGMLQQVSGETRVEVDATVACS